MNTRNLGNAPTRHFRTRRAALAAIAMALAGAAGAAGAAAAPKVVVWKTPSCGCCVDWIEHLRTNGFASIEVHETGNVSARARLGLPTRLGSCHTALIDGYVVEGHVPADDIHRLLRERPDALGLSVPGMPIGSPGMEMDGRRDPYDVLLVARDGGSSVWRAVR